MRSKGSRFTLWVWMLRVCSLDFAFMFATVRNRPQPFATVRNRSQPFATVRNRPEPSAWGPYGRAYGKFCTRGHFWRFHMRRCFVSRSRRGALWHSDCFVTCRKSFFVAGAILLRPFRKMSGSFRGRRNTLDVSIVILRGRFSTLGMSRCVFFANRIVRAASSGDKIQIPSRAWHFVWCAENLREASHETSILGLQMHTHFISHFVGRRPVQKNSCVQLSRAAAWGANDTPGSLLYKKSNSLTDSNIQSVKWI